MKLHILRQKAAKLNKAKKKAPKTKDCLPIAQGEPQHAQVPEEQAGLSQCPEADSPEVQISWLSLSTWNKNHIRNMRESRLLQLPEEILINIMRKAPPHELYILRQTCFTFFRLFQDVAFQAVQIVREIQGREVVCFNLDCFRCRRSYLPGQFSKRFEAPVLCRRGAVNLCRHYCVSMTDINGQLMSGLRAKDQRRFTFVDCEKCMKLCQSGVPAAKGHRRTVPPSISAVSRTWWFQIEWTLPIFTLGEERITDAFVLDRLRDFGNRHGRDLLCPHFEFPRLLQCFDPRICSCLGADLRIGVSSSMASSRPGLVGEPIPTCNEASKLTPGDPFIPASWDGAMEQHSVSCEYCTAVYCWARDGSVVFLQRSSPATYDTNKTSCMEGVVRQIDPVSYGIGRDYHSENIIWCEDASCRNGRDWAPVTKRLEGTTGRRFLYSAWVRM
ncbi:hypothetical protein CGCVW01_v001072 [Colletotrichum viniferum]|nr:hypothetical protein CGCVW01_v001072 [Colletotrichum viniferum]